jgi:hypothetical protein
MGHMYEHSVKLETPSLYQITIELKKTLVSCWGEWIDVLIPNKVNEMKYSIIHNAIVVVMEH